MVETIVNVDEYLDTNVFFFYFFLSTPLLSSNKLLLQLKLNYSHFTFFARKCEVVSSTNNRGPFVIACPYTILERVYLT